MAISSLVLSTAIASVTPPADPDWAGPALDETLTVTVEEVIDFSGDNRFAPLGVEWQIKVSGGNYTSKAFTTSDADDSSTTGFTAFDESFEKVHYVVHTGDSGNYRNDWVGHSSHRDKRYQYGQNCGHVYSDPGTYTGRRVYVYDDDGKWGTATLPDLTVLNPDDVFDADHTIVVDPDGDFTGAPASNNQYTTLDAAAARIMGSWGLSRTGGIRLCARAGAEFGTATNEKMRWIATTRLQFGRFLMDTWGGDAQAVYSEWGNDITSPNGSLFQAGHSGGWPWAIKNWKFDMGFDVENSVPSNAGRWDTQSSTTRIPFDHADERNHNAAINGMRFVYDNVDVVNTFSYCIVNRDSGYTKRGSMTFLNNCQFSDVYDFVLAFSSNMIALGCKLTDTYGNDLGLFSRQRVMGTNRGYRAHPTFFRESRMWTIYIRATYMESRGGWSDALGYSSQAVMRMNAVIGSGGGRIGSRVYICDSVIVGSFGMVTGNAVGMRHGIVENCLHVYDPATFDRAALAGAKGGQTVRNVVYLCMNTAKNPSHTGATLSGGDMGNFRAFISFENDGYSAGSATENLDFVRLHCTHVMLKPDAELSDNTYSARTELINSTWTEVADASTAYTMVEGNNVDYAPNLASALGPAMDTIDLPAGMRVLDVWIKHNWEKQTHTLSAAVADGATSEAIPYPQDWYGNLTTGADYTGSAKNNGVTFSGTYYAELDETYENSKDQGPANRNALTIIHDCNSSGVVQGDGTGTHFKIENRSGVTWSGSIEITLDRGTTGMEAAKVIDLTTQNANEFKLYRPTTPQALDAGVKSTLFDFQRNLRPNAGFAISPSSGTNTAGAILPA